MEFKTFYDQFEKQGISPEVFEGLEDVIETLNPEEAAKISRFAKAVDERQAAIEAGADPERLKAVSEEYEQAFGEVFEGIQQIPVQGKDQARSEFLQGTDFSAIRDSWKDVRRESADRIKELNDVQVELTAEIKRLTKEYDDFGRQKGELEASIAIAELEISEKGRPFTQLDRDFSDEDRKAFSQEEIDKIDNLRTKRGELEYVVADQAAAYDRIKVDKAALDMAVKEHTAQTLVNDYAKTQASQAAALRREQILAQARESLRERQQDLRDRAQELRHEIGRTARMIGNHIALGAKISDLNFTPIRNAIERRHQKAALKHLSAAEKTKEKIAKIEEKALAKYNKEAKKEFDKQVRANKLAKLLGREVPDLGEFTPATDATDPKVLAALNKFRTHQLDRLVHTLDNQQKDFAKDLEKIAHDKEAREAKIAPVREKVGRAFDEGVLMQKDIESFAQDLEKAGFHLADGFADQVREALNNGTLKPETIKDVEKNLKGIGFEKGEKGEWSFDDRDR